MTVENFIRNFELLTNTQVGVNQLRTMVLKLAAKGLIVRQQGEEGNASEDLATLSHSEVGELFSTDLSDTQEYPPNWAVARFPNIGKWIGGNGFPTAEQGHRNLEILFCKVSDMNLAGNSKFILESINTIDTKTAKRLKVTVLSEGTVVFPKIGGAIATNKRRIICKPTVVDNNCMGIKPSSAIDSEWLFLLLSSIDMTQYQSGTSIPSLSQRVLDQIPLGIPPLKEQKRIVKKVNELLLLCDALETNLSNQDALQSAARESVVDAVSTAQTLEELQIAWEQIQNNWEVVAGTPESIESLRSLILELAVKGKLIEQQDEDGNASELLNVIKTEKKSLQKFKPKSKSNIKTSIIDVLPDLPKNWVWTNLEEIGIINPRNSADDAIQAGFIPMASISDKFSIRHSFEVRPWGEIKKGYTHVQNGDVALAKITPCFENGKSTIISGLPNVIGAGTTEIHVIRPIRVKPDYILLFLHSPFFVLNGIPRMTGTAGQKRLPTEYFSHFPFPLPPLPEQEKIIERTNSLMQLCDELEQSLVTSSKISESFARSVISASA